MAENFDTPSPTLNPFETINRDVVSMNEMLRKIRIAVHRAPSANYNNYEPEDIARLEEFRDSLEFSFDSLVQAPKPELLEASFRVRKLKPRMDLPTVNNFITNALVRLIEDWEDEMTMSESSVRHHGFTTHMQRRAATYITRFTAHIDQAKQIMPLDLGHSHPEYALAGPGRTGVSKPGFHGGSQS